jgi:cytochrome c biogenesis protein CcmG/thiol:disulfide interchange protein DsbE
MVKRSSLAESVVLPPVGASDHVMSWRRLRWAVLWPLMTGVVLLAALLLVGVMQQGGTGLVTGSLVGAAAPDFTLTTFDGKRVRLSEQRGHPVVINFWASWCPPCRAEAATLSEVARDESSAGRAVFMGVSVRDDEEHARRFLSDFAVPYANGPDPGDLEGQYRGMGVPYTVFVDADGIVARTWIGPLDEQRLAAIIDEIA